MLQCFIFPPRAMIRVCALIILPTTSNDDSITRPIINVFHHHQPMTLVPTLLSFSTSSKDSSTRLINFSTRSNDSSTTRPINFSITSNGLSARGPPKMAHENPNECEYHELYSCSSVVCNYSPYTTPNTATRQEERINGKARDSECKKNKTVLIAWCILHYNQKNVSIVWHEKYGASVFTSTIAHNECVLHVCALY